VSTETAIATATPTEVPTETATATPQPRCPDPGAAGSSRIPRSRAWSWPSLASAADSASSLLPQPDLPDWHHGELALASTRPCACRASRPGRRPR